MEEIRINKDNTLALQCYNQIKDHIIDGILTPGQKLKIDFLKQQLGVGHSPIREALSRLTASGLVEAQDNKGFRVAKISKEDIHDTYKTFFQIEMLALKQAMESGDDTWESGIVAALHHLSLIENKKEPVLYHVWAERNYAFHLALISGCNSPLLLQIRTDVRHRFERYGRMSFNLAHTKLELNHQEHMKLAQAVLSRDIELVTTLMEHHLFWSLDRVIKILTQNNKL